VAAPRATGGTLMTPIMILTVVVVVLLSGLRIVQQWQRGVVFRLGRYVSTRDPGVRWIVPLMIDVMRVVDVRVVTLAIEPQESMTKDNVPVKVRAVVWYRVTQPREALVEIESYTAAVTQTSLTALRTVMGKHSLDEVLKEQDQISMSLKELIDRVTEPWGVQVERVEMKDVEIPQSMQRAMAQEAEALREKRARIIKAEAEFEAAVKLRQAADEIGRSAPALELRRMQMLTEIGAEQNTMTVIMMPSEFVSAAGALAAKLNAKSE
jgi:regulator of protease activity HflC (stomatin/prohibitin superfamily)